MLNIYWYGEVVVPFGRIHGLLFATVLTVPYCPQYGNWVSAAICPYDSSLMMERYFSASMSNQVGAMKESSDLFILATEALRSLYSMRNVQIDLVAHPPAPEPSMTCIIYWIKFRLLSLAFSFFTVSTQMSFIVSPTRGPDRNCMSFISFPWPILAQCVQ